MGPTVAFMRYGGTEKLILFRFSVAVWIAASIIFVQDRIQSKKDFCRKDFLEKCLTRET